MLGKRFCLTRALTSLCRRVFGPPRGSAASARERLRILVLCDRTALSEVDLERLKWEMAAVARKYLAIDPSRAAVEVKRRGSHAALVATFPLHGSDPR